MRRDSAGGLVLLALAVAACGRGGQASAPRVERPAAIVGGRPVAAAWVAAVIRNERLDAEHALRRVVETAVLAEAARARGLDRGPSLAAERRALLVRMLLRRQVLLSEPLDDEDRATLERAYRETLSWYVRPEIRTVEHLAVVLDKSDGSHRGVAAPSASPAAWDLAAEVVRELAPLARGAASPEAFGALRALLERRWRKSWEAAGLDPAKLPRVVAESVGPFDAEGPYDPAFRSAAFALEQPGDVSDAVRTEFGWHLIYLQERLPPRNSSFEEALPDLLERNRTALEARRTVDLVTEALSRRGGRTHPELLSRTLADGGRTTP